MSDIKGKRTPREAAAPVNPVSQTETSAVALTAEPVLTASTPEAASEPQSSAQAGAETERRGGEDLFAFGQEALSALTETHDAVARGVEAFSSEIAGLARSGLSAVTESTTALLGAKTLADAFEVQSAFARRSVDAAIDGSAKLSEIGVRMTTEASKPILSRLGEVWKVARFG